MNDYSKHRNSLMQLRLELRFHWTLYRESLIKKFRMLIKDLIKECFKLMLKLEDLTRYRMILRKKMKKCKIQICKRSEI